MERKRRRLWTLALSTAAALVVLAATLSLSFRLIVDSVPGYRDKLQNVVSQAAGHPARIGSMALTWQGLRPSLDLRDVALLDDQGKPLLQLSRLLLGFSLERLLKTDWMPSTVDIYGLKLEADVDALGHWSMHGFSGGGGALSDEQIQQIARLERVRLRDCRLLLHDPQIGQQTLSVGVTDVLVSREGQHYTASAHLRPPPELAADANASAALQGDPAKPETWQGSWSVLVDNIQGWPWMSGVLAPGVRLTLQQARLNLRGQIEAGHVTQIDAQANADAIAALHDRDTLTELTQLELELSAWPEPQAWRGEIRKLTLSGARGIATADAHFRYAVTPQGDTLDAGADGLRLDDLAPWLALWKGLPAGAARVSDLRGDVHDLALHYEHSPAVQSGAGGGAGGGATAAAADVYSLRARLAGAGLAADPTQPGFSGLDGVIEANQDGGHLQLQQTALNLQLPKVFQQPLPVTALSGDFNLKRNDPGLAAGWRISAQQFDWKAVSTSGHGQFSLLLPNQSEASPNLQLSADFASDDPTTLKPWMPNDWGANTREWLNRALRHGQLPQGHLQFDGPLADYPFVDRPTGKWLLDLSVADGTLDYAPGWPAADKLQAQLHFRGNGLQISVSSAQVAGNPIDHIEAQIPDFRQGRLTVDGSTHSDAARYYALLGDSPLKTRLEGLLGQTEAAGPTTAELHLEILLNQEHLPVHASGKVHIDEVTLKVHGIDTPVTALRGNLAFDDDGVSSDGVSGQLYGSVLSATIHPEADSPVGVLLVQADAPVQTAAGLFATYTPDWLRSFLSGTAHIQARMPFSGPHAGQVVLSSDLRGVAMRLPLPLAKNADQILPLTVTVGDDGTAKSGDADALLVNIDGAERVGVALRFARPADAANAGKKPLLHSVAVRLGPGAMPRAEGEGIFVSGAPAVLDIGSWSDLLDSIGEADQAASGAPPSARAVSGNSGLALRGFDLTPQRLVYHFASLQQVHLRGAPTAGGWSAQLDGANALGSVEFSRANGGRLQARLQRLLLQPFAAIAQDSGDDDKNPPIDPDQVPVLDLSCDSLKIGAADLGRFSLLSSRIAGGQSLDQLKLEGGQVQTSTRGTWLRRNGSSYADLSFEFNSSDLGKALLAFGFAETMDAKKSSFSGTLTWPQDPGGIELSQARGTVTLAVEKGTLRTVEPGAGRVLGLLNLYALPRRLIFDFHDVVSKGLSFDSLSGNFKLADGQAQTKDMQLVSPALKLEMSGRIGLAARDYDEKITVHPDVSTAVIVGATLVNPIAGGVALLAQEVFNKPFNKLSQFSYRVTGSWDNPQVNGADNKDTTKPQPAPAPSPAPTAPPPQPAQPAPPSDAG
jgi:uncharacterized protein (TIGR02099 family)